MACGLWRVATDMDTDEENGGSAESIAAENNELEGRGDESFVAVDLEVGIEGVQVATNWHTGHWSDTYQSPKGRSCSWFKYLDARGAV